MKKRPERLAHVWTPEGIETIEIKGEWPRLIVIKPWAYERPGSLRDEPARPRRGPRTGVEIVEFKVRMTWRQMFRMYRGQRPLLLYVKGKDDGRNARADRSSQESRPAVANDGRAERRRHFGAKSAGTAVRAGNARDRHGDGRAGAGSERPARSGK